MEIMLIKPENKSQQLFLHEFMKKNQIKWNSISEENIEDAFLLQLMLQSNINETVPEDEIMKILEKI